MSEPDNILDVDFDSQMRGLFQQAEQAIGKRAAAEDAARAAVDVAPRDGENPVESAKGSEHGIAGDLGPVMNTLATVSKTAEEHASLLARIERATAADDAA